MDASDLAVCERYGRSCVLDALPGCNQPTGKAAKSANSQSSRSIQIFLNGILNETLRFRWSTRFEGADFFQQRTRSLVYFRKLLRRDALRERYVGVIFERLLESQPTLIHRLVHFEQLFTPLADLAENH